MGGLFVGTRSTIHSGRSTLAPAEVRRDCAGITPTDRCIAGTKAGRATRARLTLPNGRSVCEPCYRRALRLERHLRAVPRASLAEIEPSEWGRRIIHDSLCEVT